MIQGGFNQKKLGINLWELDLQSASEMHENYDIPCHEYDQGGCVQINMYLVRGERFLGRRFKRTTRESD